MEWDTGERTTILLYGCKDAFDAKEIAKGDVPADLHERIIFNAHQLTTAEAYRLAKIYNA
jgi:hypothetical protein